MAHGLADDFMCVAEGDALAHEVIGQIGGGGEALAGGGTHAGAIRLDGGDHVGKGAQAAQHGVDGIEQRLFVFLIVLVVGQRLAFHQRQQGE